MTTPLMEHHPDDLPNAPMLSPTVVDILCRHFEQQLRLGKPLDLYDGVDPEVYAESAVFYETRSHDMEQSGDLTYAILLQAAVYKALAQGDMGRVRVGLLNTSSILLSWLEDIDRRGNS